MRAFKLPLIAFAGAVIAVPAAAQETTPAPAQDSAAPAQAAPAPAQAATPVSDAEVEQFASAVVEVDKINKDTTIAAAEKQPRMASAVTSSGLTPERFNQIATSMNSDSALQQKVGAAIQAKAPAAASAPAPGATEPAPAPATPPGE